MEVSVDCNCLMQLVLSSGAHVSVPTRLSYSTQDPYAVHVVFDAYGDAPVTWVFARDLLAEGVLRPSGLGDVRIWPATSKRRGMLNLALCSFDGYALLTAPLAMVMPWLKRTYELVPAGQEAQTIDFDDWLSRLLGEVT